MTHLVLASGSKSAPRFLAIALALFCAQSLAGSWAQAQVSSQNVEQSATYVSQIDDDLTIRRIAILPTVDNVDGIYARPIEAQLTTLLKASHRWDFVEANVAGELPSALDMEENPATVQKLTRSLDADAFIVSSASRGPDGLSIRLDLFLKRDGKLVAQELVKDFPRSEIAGVREQVNQLYKRLLSKLPYDGILLSRQANRVTVNLGKSDGLAKDQIITAVQIISVNRHPRFNFIISSEKEILGRIKILKVDETLSFGAIISEKEKGAIRRFAKIAGLNPVDYPVPDRLGAEGGDIKDRADSPVTFGNNPKEWLPTRPPSFGLVGFNIGVGNYTSNTNIQGLQSFEAKSSIYPSLGIYGELWLNPEWTVRAELGQALISAPNPRSGSTPSELNHQETKYNMSVAYNFLLHDDFFGPKLQLSGGFGSDRMFVDNSSPAVFTTTTFSGFMIGVAGSFPVDDEKLWFLGGKLNLYVLPKLVEEPTASGGNPKASVSDFSLFLEKKISENMRITGSLDFALYSANFSGAGGRPTEIATSLSQRHTSLTGGLVYMF
jgi:hypothetical protein